MNSMLARYLDGELEAEEAREFLDALERDPELATELRRTERLLAAGRAMTDTSVPEGFTEAVMERVAEDDVAPRPATPVARRWAWMRPLAAAAVLALVFLGGLRLGGDRTEPLGDPTAGATAIGPQLHSVRLVYVPSGDRPVDEVHVAGDFNAWDRGNTPLRRVDGVWTTTLVLPPGDYEYMFVENGERWVTDPLAARTRADGFGGSNAVLDVGV